MTGWHIVRKNFLIHTKFINQTRRWFWHWHRCRFWLQPKLLRWETWLLWLLVRWLRNRLYLLRLSYPNWFRSRNKRWGTNRSLVNRCCNRLCHYLRSSLRRSLECSFLFRSSAIHYFFNCRNVHNAIAFARKTGSNYRNADALAQFRIDAVTKDNFGFFAGFILNKFGDLGQFIHFQFSLVARHN